MGRVEALMSQMYGGGVTFNRTDMKIRLPSGATIHGASMHEGESGYLRWQGVNLSALFAEEVTNLSTPHFAMMRKLESNIRPTNGRKAVRVLTCNPGGLSSGLVYRQWLSKVPPWTAAIDDSGLTFFWSHSTMDDNIYLPKDYERSLTASAGADKLLLKAWRDGDFSAIGGLLFSFMPEKHLIRTPPPHYIKRFGKPFFAVDWGHGAPAVGILGYMLRESMNWDGRRLPYGSIILVAETDTVIDDMDLSLGSGVNAQSFAEQCADLLSMWDVRRPDCVIDSAKGLVDDTVRSIFQKAGIPSDLPEKGPGSRVRGWNNIREMMGEAVLERGRPALYFTQNVPHTIQTISEMPRSRHNVSDCEPKFPDHWGDSVRYLLTMVGGGPKSSQSQVIGMW